MVNGSYVTLMMFLPAFNNSVTPITDAKLESLIKVIISFDKQTSTSPLSASAIAIRDLKPYVWIQTTAHSFHSIPLDSLPYLSQNKRDSILIKGSYLIESEYILRRKLNQQP